MDKQIIGLIGYKQSGKDTIADYLVKNYNYHKLSFAEPLKEICKILFNFDEEQLYGNKKEIIDINWNITPRQVYQFVGTHLFRNEIQKLLPNINDNFWVEILKQKIVKLLNENKKIVISDIRFLNELSMIKSFGSLIIKITRANNICVNDHESEKYIDIFNYDIAINNNGSINELYNDINLIFNI